MENTSSPNSTVNTRDLKRAASVIAGTILVYYGAKKRTFLSVGLAFIGTALVRKGALGTSSRKSCMVTIDRVVKINKPREEVFRFWHNLENLPKFMTGLKAVKTTGANKSHWVMKGPGKRMVEWDAEIVDDLEGKYLSWRSLPGARVPNSGIVRFDDAAGGRGTIVRLAISYDAPGGLLGRGFAAVMGVDLGATISEDLRRLKSILESGQVANAQVAVKTRAADEKQVHAASEGSFPASDAPAY